MKKSIYLGVLILTTTVFVFSGCKRGEEDPWLTFHSRDARMTQQWLLVSLQGTIVETFDNDSIVNTEYTFDGTNLYETSAGETDSYGFIYKMNVKSNGEIFSEEFRTNAIDGTSVSESSRIGFWFWGSDDKNKSSVNLDLTGLLSSYTNYDIPRLAWNDMTLAVSSSDNYTLSTGESYSINTNFELNFEVDLDALAQ
ncbi:MAG: hypothetical protein H7Y00_03670 [Fimbriimonadaceae bacterium]|nr:hypothetical protein [Chitinophagales bacterium]